MNPFPFTSPSLHSFAMALWHSDPLPISTVRDSVLWDDLSGVSFCTLRSQLSILSLHITSCAANFAL